MPGSASAASRAGVTYPGHRRSTNSSHPPRVAAASASWLQITWPDRWTCSRWSRAVGDSTRWAAYSAAGFLALGFLATLRLTGSRRREEHLEAHAPSSDAAKAAEPTPTA